MTGAPPGGGPRLYCLIVENATSGNAPGRATPPPARFELTARETIVGRDPSCAIRLDDLFVSRRHARLLLRGSDLHLDDLASTNVTRRNGEPVRTRVRLQPGDVLQFASVRARLAEVAPDAPEESPVPPEAAVPPETADPPGGEAEGAEGAATEGAGARVPAPTGPRPAVEAALAPPGEATPAGGDPLGAGDPLPGADRREEVDAPDRAGGRKDPEPKDPEPLAAAPPESRNGEEPARPKEPASGRRPTRTPAPEVFVAGPLPGEAGRARVRAALWIVALTTLAALGAALLR